MNVGFISDIAAFYPIDEPNVVARVKYSIKHPNGPAPTPEELLPYEEKIAADLELVGAAIKRSFPDIPIAVIFGATNRPIIPKNFDWVGFDCYGYFGNCGGLSIW